MATQPERLGFREYSFESPPRRRHASPGPAVATVAQRSFPPNPQHVSASDVNVLTHQFSQQSIRYETLVPSNSYTGQVPVQQEAQSYSAYVPSPTASPLPVPHNCPHTSPSIRSQRQVNTRLQCQPSHVREISTLVEQMIASGEQCFVCSPTPQREASAPAWNEDEGMADDAIESWPTPPSLSVQTLNYRRSTDLSTSQHYVSKSIRIRKKRKHRGDSSKSQR